jgi:hypothetical protein
MIVRMVLSQFDVRSAIREFVKAKTGQYPDTIGNNAEADAAEYTADIAIGQTTDFSIKVRDGSKPTGGKR